MDERLGPDLVHYGGDLWSRCRARKGSLCVLSGRKIWPRDEVYRPITNGYHRMKRILATAMDARIPQALNPPEGEGR